MDRLAQAKQATTIGMLAMAPISHSSMVTTTLYSLIETLQDQAIPEDDTIVTAAVTWLCDAGCVKFLSLS